MWKLSISKRCPRTKSFVFLLKKEIAYLDKISNEFDTKSYKKIARNRINHNHDLQAVVVYIQRHLEGTSLKDLVEMIHFGLTSDDINNLSYALMLQSAVREVFLPELQEVEQCLTGNVICV